MHSTTCQSKSSIKCDKRSESNNRHSSAGMQVAFSHEQVGLALFLFGLEQQEGPLDCLVNSVKLETCFEEAALLLHFLVSRLLIPLVKVGCFASVP